MEKQRELSSEQILYALMKLREEETNKNNLIKKVVVQSKCRPIGSFPYTIKETGEIKYYLLYSAIKRKK